MRKEEKWEKECMEERERTVRGAEKIESQVEREDLIQKKRENSEYWMEAAENLLETSTPQAAIVMGYYAAQAKAEEALAHEEIKVYSHGCTYKGVSRVLEEKELGKALERAYKTRKNVNYETSLITQEKDPKNFLENRIKPLIQNLEDKIEEIRE